MTADTVAAPGPMPEWLTVNNSSIPVLPTLASRVIELASDPDMSVGHLANVIAKDQVLASRLLALANSAFCAPLQAITTIPEAVIRVGTTGVRNMVFTVCFSSRMYDPAVYGNAGRQLIDHGLGTAYLARIVADRAGESPDEAFLCGLLHDIGKLLILKLAYDYKRRTGTTIPDSHVAAAMDQQHAALGAATLQKWGLPASLDEPVRCHHAYTEASGTPAAAMVVYLANRLSHRYGFGCEADADGLPSDPVFTRLRLDSAWLADTDARAPGLFDIARRALTAPAR